MDYNYWDIGQRKRGEVVQVTLRGSAANVLLLDRTNYSAFKGGRQHRYFGGLAKRSPVRLTIPHSGHWYVVVHFGGARGRSNVSVSVLPGALPPIHGMGAPSLSSIRDAAEAYTETEGDQVPEPEAKAHDVFISHASEDKDEVVRPLAAALSARGVDVWLDEAELRIGDSLRRKIDAGISRCRFGVVVLSPSFFGKGWPNYELDGLVTREIAGGEQIILPIWHKVTHAEVMGYSASLAGKLARRTVEVSVEDIADEIAQVVQT